MLKVLSYILCDLDPKVKVIGQKAGICDGVPSTFALVVVVSLSNQYVDTIEQHALHTLKYNVFSLVNIIDSQGMRSF